VYFVKRPNHENIVTTCGIADFSLLLAQLPRCALIRPGKIIKLIRCCLCQFRLKRASVPDAINGSNRNGTEDVCGMQVNSSHYGKLKNFNITRERLLNDPCICVYTGAWVLAHNFRSYGKNWDSVGMYNTGPSKKLIAQRKAYAQDIKNIYRVLLARKSYFLNVWRQLRERSMR
jgi:hypothetical protein